MADKSNIRKECHAVAVKKSASGYLQNSTICYTAL
jgi:hypothetical protein